MKPCPLTVNHYKEGALVTIVGTYKNPAQALTDPSGCEGVQP